MLTDNGIPQLSSTTRIVVNVDDVNDHTPEFDQKFYKVQIPANAKVDQALFQVIQSSQLNSTQSIEIPFDFFIFARFYECICTLLYHF